MTAAPKIQETVTPDNDLPALRKLGPTPRMITRADSPAPVATDARWITILDDDTPDGCMTEHVIELADDRAFASRSPDWHQRALCARLPLDLSDRLYFGVDDRTAPESLILAVDGARTVCAQCPVMRECLTAALANDERYGVWGGTSGKERAKMQARIADGEDLEGVVNEWMESR